MTRRCEFCGRSVTRDPRPDAERVFCSSGCASLAGTFGGHLDASGTATYPPAPPPQTSQASPDSSPPTTTFLHIDGIHNATCERFLESVASSLEGVTTAEASYVSEMIRIEHDPNRTTAEDLQTALSVLGYQAVDLPPDATARSHHSRSPDHHPESPAAEGLLGYRYVAGVVFGTFLLLPYVIYLYPIHLAPYLGLDFLSLFSGPNTSVGEGLPLILPPFMVITGVVLFFTGAPLLRGALVSVKMRRPTTDLLVGLTVTSAFLFSVLAMVTGRLDVYFDLTVVVAAGVVAAMYYDALVKREAAHRLTDLTFAQVAEANRYSPDGTTTRIPRHELEPGDRVLVRQGDRVPVDGVLTEGSCMVDEAIVTGESLPRMKESGDQLLGGAVVTDGSAVLEVGASSTSRLGELTSTVWGIQSADHGIQRDADAVASRVIPVLGVVGVVVGAGALFLGATITHAVLATLLVVIAGCPWALGLATPLSAAAGVKAALERDIVVFDDTIFERLRSINTIVFDKTGTLTTGAMEVLDVDAPRDAVEAAAALERHSSHPIGTAIAEAFAPEVAEADGGTPPEAGGDHAPTVTEFQTHAKGVTGTVDDTPVQVGHLELFTEADWTVADWIISRVHDAYNAGRLPIVVGRDGAAEGLVLLGDRPRSDWTDAVTQLADREIDIVVLTGDDEAATDFITQQPGVSHVFAGVPPEGKTAAIRALQQNGPVAMVGDGTNDAPALATADLGIALGSGTALASEAADIAIVDNILGTVSTAFDVAETVGRRVQQNNRLALVYNALVIPLAVVGSLNPLFAMGAVAVTAALITANANRPIGRVT